VAKQSDLDKTSKFHFDSNLKKLDSALERAGRLSTDHDGDRARLLVRDRVPAARVHERPARSVALLAVERADLRSPAKAWQTQ
jgi:hypothetical protein